MKFAKIISKMPLFCLLVLSILIADGIYDKILPWPSPFCIQASSDDDSFSVTFTVNDALLNKTQSVSADRYIPTDFDGEPDTEDPFAGFSALLADSDPNHPGHTPEADTPLENTQDTEPTPPAKPLREIGEDGLPLVHYLTVEDDYFDDAVFIGDSRIRSLQLYAKIDHTTFLADTGLSVYTVLTRKLTPSDSSSKTTVSDYLATHQFKKVYLMLGVNELGIGTSASFCEKYAEVLNTIRELQPDAIIYVQAILHISEKKHKEGTYVNNNTIITRNEAIRPLADNVHIFWLDANPVLCDEKGFLIGRYTFDGVHLQAKYVSLWTDFLREHAIDEEDLLLDLPENYAQNNSL